MPSMVLTVLKSKLHRATVTRCDLTYEGSITIDRALMEGACILPFEQVDVLNISNGERFTTYAIEGAENSGIIGINGAAARLCEIDDQVIICAYGQLEQDYARNYKPTVLTLNADNTVKTTL